MKKTRFNESELEKLLSEFTVPPSRPDLAQRISYTALHSQAHKTAYPTRQFWVFMLPRAALACILSLCFGFLLGRESFDYTVQDMAKPVITADLLYVEGELL